MRAGNRGIFRGATTGAHTVAICSAVAVIASALALLAVAGAAARPAAALRAPVPLSPSDGETTGDVPAFGWKPVAGADQYEFQIAADPGFNSPVLGRGQDDYVTRNTRATLKKVVPNGTYWWRVRAINSAGTASPWSSGRSIRKLWAEAPVPGGGTASTLTLKAPANGSTFQYGGSAALTLTWDGVPGARKYLVSLARDRELTSLVPIGGAAHAVETQATSFTPNVTLAPGDYWWGVRPVDAEGNVGAQAGPWRFTWAWDSTTSLSYKDLDNGFEVVDSQLSWTPVSGAAKYEVEINSSIDFAPGSKVCCSGSTIGTSLSPTDMLSNNTYYWRVRAIDPSGNAGCWAPRQCDPSQPWPSFVKTFDNPGPSDGPSVKNLHMRSNLADPGVDENGSAPGYQTYSPIITWNPVPGASSYEVDVTPYDRTRLTCDWTASTLSSQWDNSTAVTAWTPLASGPLPPKPYPDSMNASFDSQALVPNQPYCARVRARSDRAGSSNIYGDYTYLRSAGQEWAFEYTGPDPTVSTCIPSNAGYPCASDYLSPVFGVVTPRAPLFTWKTISGAKSYWVIVAKDPSFTTIVDYAVTQIPAYAPRTLNGPRTYSDEFTSYYWAVLPAVTSTNGAGAPGNPLFAAPPNFQKRSVPPSLDPVSFGPYGVPTFQWHPPTGPDSAGARKYRLQVSTDPSFGALLDDISTDSTSYTANKTYPAAKTLYWRVRADDENLVGLTWSATGSFTKTLPRPVPIPGVTSSDAIPTWTWTPAPGALWYDVAVDLPDGSHKELTGFPSPAMTPVLMYGTGYFSWRVRAEFPSAPSGVTPGPWVGDPRTANDQPMKFSRTIGEPQGARVDAAVDHILLSWNAKPQVRGYQVQLSANSSFVQPLETIATDNTSYAPPLKWLPVAGLDTGRLYWRVAAVDEGNTVGDWATGPVIRRTRRMSIVLQGSLKRRRRSMLMVSVKNFESGAVVPGVRLRISGAGIRTRRVRASGLLLLRLRPTRRGVVHFTASASGYQPAQANARVN